MRREDLVDLNAFMAVAEEKSFTRAAARLGTSQSALSHTVRRLETRLGVRLLTRTTRAVAPTAAGDRLLATLGPALETIDAQLASLIDVRDKPAGTIRITTAQHAADTVLWPMLEPFLARYPDVQVELLATTRRGAADVVTSRKRLELQLRQLEGRADVLHAEAVELVRQGQDEPARTLLTQHAGLLTQVEQLVPQERSLRASEEQLLAQVDQIEARVEVFRGEMDALAAGLTAAQAQARATTAMSGLDEELGDAGSALQRARERTEVLQAQADALDELTALGATSPADAALRRFEALSGGGVEAELARLKGAQALLGPLPGPLLEPPSRDQA